MSNNNKILGSPQRLSNISNNTNNNNIKIPNKEQILNIKEYEQLSKQILPKMVFDYYWSGADDMITVKENELNFQKIKLRPRMLINSNIKESHLNTTCTFNNIYNNIDNTIDDNKKKITTPILIAPAAFHKMCHVDGELATVRASKRLGTIMTLSTCSTISLENVMNEYNNYCIDNNIFYEERRNLLIKSKIGTLSNEEELKIKNQLLLQQNKYSNLWFQLYVLKDREFTKNLVKRAEKEGYSALVVTVDAPNLGNRENDKRNNFHLPFGMTMANLENVLGQVDNNSISALNRYFEMNIDDSLTWKDIEWLKTITKLPIIIKGLLSYKDILIAINNYNIKGIIISNHGGRQLDTSISTIHSLIEINYYLNKFNKRNLIDLIIDGGIRRGTDIFKAIALGADAVMIGRPYLYGLTVHGQEGVERVISLLHRELRLCMQLCGCESLNDIREKRRDLIVFPNDIYSLYSNNDCCKLSKL